MLSWAWVWGAGGGGQRSPQLQRVFTGTVLGRWAAGFMERDPGDPGCGMEGKEETEKMGMKIGRSSSEAHEVARKAPAPRLEVWSKVLPAGTAKAELAIKRNV